MLLLTPCSTMLMAKAEPSGETRMPPLFWTMKMKLESTGDSMPAPFSQVSLEPGQKIQAGPGLFALPIRHPPLHRLEQPGCHQPQR